MLYCRFMSSSNRTARLTRRLDLLSARLASARGDVATATALFAKHGISYVPAVAS
jgi:hypothetical protein